MSSLEDEVSHLLNDRDVVLSIVAEHVTFDDKYLKKAKIRPITESPQTLAWVDHCGWQFTYDSRSNIIYLKLHPQVE